MNEEQKPVEFHHDLTASIKSNLAPLWLVFKSEIFNTQQIINMHNMDDYLLISTTDGHQHKVYVGDIKKVWESLQTVFSEGATA